MRPVRYPILDGMVPLRQLLYNEREVSLVKHPTLRGIVPVKLREDRAILRTTPLLQTKQDHEHLEERAEEDHWTNWSPTLEAPMKSIRKASSMSE
jgi:hypothetical protein